MAKGILKVKILGDASGLHKSLGDTESRLGKFGKALTGAFVVGGAAAAGGLAMVTKAGFGFNSSIEQTTISLKTMLGSQQKANDLIAEMTKFAAETPFEFPELADATKKLIAFGVNAEDIIPTMTTLGDLAAALNVPVGELSELYGKAKVQGRLYMEDINQLTGRGIPVIQEFAKQFGVSEDKVRGLVEQGKIGFPELQTALKNLTGEGGKFAGLMEAQSKSMAGLFSTLKDEFNQIAGILTKPVFDWIANTILPKMIEGIGYLREQLQNADSPMRTFFDGLIEKAQFLGTIFNPLGAILVEAIKKLYDWAMTNKGELYGFFEQFTPLLDALQGVFETVWPAVQDAVQMFIDFFTGETGQIIIVGLIEGISGVLNLMSDVFADVWPYVKKLVQGFIDWFNSDQGQMVITTLLDGIKGAISTLRDVWGAAFDNVIKPAADAFVKWWNSPEGQQTIKTLVDDLKAAMQLLRDLWNEAWPAMKQAVEAISPYIGPLIGAILTMVSNLAQNIRDLLALLDRLANQGPTAGGGYKWGPTTIYRDSDVPYGNVPKYAAGGPIPGDGPVPIMAHGGEYVLTRGDTTLMQRLIAAVERGGAVGTTGSSRNITINVSGNSGIDIARQVVTALAGVA